MCETSVDIRAASELLHDQEIAADRLMFHGRVALLLPETKWKAQSRNERGFLVGQKCGSAGAAAPPE
jgi:hypothetical protein